eukprot:43605-Pyramimonas_sp.AAC.1
MVADDCHRSEPDVADRREDIHLHHPVGKPAARPRLPGWAKFDIQISLHDLRSLDPSVAARELRKLHLRWFHAKEPTMRLLLTKAGLDNVRLNPVKGVCGACRGCRAWDKPGHAVVPSTALPGKFNEEVECDLLFYK